ncbi:MULTISPECIES: ABC transporter permease [Nocardiopsis]|jgi:putative spermidine/putrescine transport system permease protein|uniref:Binding-protein-dependent transport systems inner membrane component n=1 Tax=Nocardiopsis dassonvillei (strain ATCC 23218 / DSM 43111 / CIP 107115 / JCM 7437 / KCTC 9190 / NBRC 14626 / NCTC 10488 / NRRL B-5397 / IMRU 509) TaxID=446468 RepID=D7B685_NOCDD|nr:MULTISPECIES: ABC transporter permease [Nocardiopsis]ADH67350.1 binding-protein-dependent transport systems inner membrane component [Nocardiopsis dassonvillei subsp. dassonvillei DSM 43111]APC35562.1 ABC transporter permease [Nocardiopsis dassonvillei]ASU58456.1 ABC transporter permease [Nocardiopsis dassonvillei]NKY77353.1 ABC transporter permease [Nocardiopsis dassonvillei]VEI87485.1 Inner membrane ABC transporter permease protein ydcV [Nocardiopsis dassonvillei]
MILRRPFLSLLAAAAFVLMLGPVVILVGVAFTAGSTLAFPPEGLSLRWFAAALDYGPFVDSFGTSVAVALASTAIALLLGVPATLALHRGNPRGRRVMENLFFAPIVVPELVLSLALFQQLMVGMRVTALGALIVGHTVLLLPYTVRVVGASLSLADARLEEAARGLGAGPVRAFFTVTLPVMAPGILSATILAFITSLNNVPLSLLLTGPGVATLPVEMLNYVQSSFDPVVAAVSVLLLVLSVAVAFATERMVGFTKVFGR